ncbi:unnamed protein product [Cylindrotheca closterium]|uniref:Propionyl-CoA carboxylase alpha chain, mitochondrial n=1 Tax=Cylindrotheca closterium TaxID=2856 RepID=A0AAD2FDQ9_9STRA|nr:unnamed protein product [Cylindrotheca closterium]
MLRSQLSKASRKYWTSRFFSTEPPFSKVLVSNRGEICQRVFRTCKELGVKTVAIYSTADSKAPFVKAADEAVCVGPAAAGKSYLNVERVLQVIRDTGADAVHPGYGFLSENANFCQSIESEGVAWLGPPVSAIQDMGDKIRSKEIAEAAGVSIIPGYDGTIDSIDQCVEVSNQIGYPVLVKAAAGGGGKGMRTCYNDQEVREAYPMAKSEAKQFFSDDRLLVEKFIENPHHIEFQVLCSPPAGGKLEKPEDLQVVVFPERECSIQRRNQKVVEESPSCLLTDETRQKMAEQVKMLCQKVGYVSAGTVEWLVDEEQNFYFLEMNTRLQVEHPISEAVTGVDLVKGMLWVAAGRGLPPEFQIDGLIMPSKGHAIECRIYAEDPLRGYLPSTGPLLPYIEPHATGEGESYLRLDSGVIQGHAVTPFYDPMLSKIISYAPTRREAIDIMTKGLDEYVIEGVQHNARLCNAVLRHPAFVKGETPTSFLPRHLPDWAGVQLTLAQEEELAVAVALIGMTRDSFLQRPTVVPSFEPMVVRLGGFFGDAFRVTMGDEKSAIVQKLGDDGAEARTILVNSIKYDPTRFTASVSMDREMRSIQVMNEDSEGEMKVQMYGADMPCLIQSEREYQLSQYMHVPKMVDTSDMVMSPMPGTLISFSVSEGDHVEIGQELCIVEAMKMQNIVRSPRTGTIGKLSVPEGASLVTDQIIIEFGVEETEEAA